MWQCMSEGESPMYPTDFDGDVFASYQRRELRRIRRQSRASAPSLQPRHTLAQAVAAIVHRFRQPKWDAPVARAARPTAVN